jgi:hypothetical protein
MPAQLGNAAHVDIEAGNPQLTGKRHGKRQADIAQPHHHNMLILHLLRFA